MFRPQPNLKVSERTVPIEYLYEQGKEKSWEMKNFQNFVSPSQNSTEKEKQDPKEMYQYNDIRKNFENHFVWPCGDFLLPL